MEASSGSGSLAPERCQDDIAIFLSANHPSISTASICCNEGFLILFKECSAMQSDKNGMSCLRNTEVKCGKKRVAHLGSIV